MNKKFSSGQKIEFIKKALVFEEESNESYQVLPGAKGVVVEDRDIGEAGNCRIEIEKKGGEKVIVVVDDKNIEVA